jgi:hypothetical protein
MWYATDAKLRTHWNDKSWKTKGPQPWFGRVWMILNPFVLGVRMEKGAILGMRDLGKVRAEQGIWISRMAYLRLLLGINKWEDFFIFCQTLAVIWLSATWLYSVPYIYMKWQWKIHSKNNLSMEIYIFWKRKSSRIGEECFLIVEGPLFGGTLHKRWLPLLRQKLNCA